uniref:Hydroxylysine kinase n=1 Tax=Ciona savignyi TaxID=51511 RepID=H2YN20_CIOSA
MHDWRPAIQEVKEAVESMYDLPVAAVTQLAGYDDLNYKVQSGEKFYALKIKHLAYDGENASSILTQHIMVHLFDNDLNVPQAIQPKSGTGTTVQYQFESSKSPRMMQLSTFLPGRSIFESRPSPERLLSIAYRVGKLCSVYMESLQILTRRISLENNQVPETNDMWKPHNFLRARPLLHYVTDEKLKEIISEYFDLFQKTFSLVQNKLRRGLIHGDFSTTNIIEDEDGQLGVLDFEDSGFNYIVFDLAICIAYFMVS